MRDEYQAFIEKYHAKLIAEDPFGSETANAKPVSHPSQHIPKIEPVWEFTDIKLAGNVITDPAFGTLWVLDGWQTIVEFDADTRQARRIPLNVAPTAALTKIRRFQWDSRAAYLAFAELGPDVYLFDESWKLTGSFHPGSNFITDVQVPRAADSHLVVLDNSNQLTTVDPRSMEAYSSAKLPLATSLSTVLDGTTWQQRGWKYLSVLSDGSCATLSDSLQLDSTFKLPDLRLVRVSPAAGSEIAACGVALNRQGTWVAVGLDVDFGVVWTEPIGSQEFQTQIEPVDHIVLRETELWAIAGSDSTITVVDETGTVRDRWQCGESIRGLAWLSQPKGDERPAGEVPLQLVVSLESKLVSVAVSVPSK